MTSFLLDHRAVLLRGAAAVPLRRRRGRSPAVHAGRAERRRPAAQARRGRRRGRHRGRTIRTFTEARRSHRRQGARRGGRLRGSGAGPSAPGPSTFVRRLHGSPAARAASAPTCPTPRSTRLGSIVRSRWWTSTTSTIEPSGSWSAWCRRAFELKERSGQARPLQFVLLDELNKYAPVEGSSPIKEILLDVAEA